MHRKIIVIIIFKNINILEVVPSCVCLWFTYWLRRGTEVGEQRTIRDHSCLYSKLHTRENYIARSCLKKQNKFSKLVLPWCINVSQHHTLPYKFTQAGTGAKEIVHSWVLADLENNYISLPSTLDWRLTINCNSGSRESKAFWWPHHTGGIHTKRHMHILANTAKIHAKAPGWWDKSLNNDATC